MSDASGNLRVVVDTNVLVSAAISHRGLPRRVLDAWEHGSFQLLMADAMLAEVTDVLHRDAIRQKYHLTDEQIAQLVHDLTVATERVIPHEPPPVSSRDPKDDPLLAVALSGHADYLITGDDDLLVLQGDPRLGTLQIVTARDFVQLLAELGGGPA
jgi:putative PIN family toxin of toxin-antitoxin system